jgi:glutathione S-transferase
MLGYINSELHKSYAPLFHSTFSREQRDAQEAHLRKRYAIVDKVLATRPYLLGTQFSVADAYLFVVTRWAAYVNLDLSELENLTAFQARVAARPAVQAAIAAEMTRASA